MGNIFGTSHTLDANYDGVVTREEMETFFREQLSQQQHLPSERERRLELELKELQDAYAARLIRSQEKVVHPSNIEISNERIAEVADGIIRNPATNIQGFPDFVERRIYENALKIMLSTIAGASERSSIQIAGHEIRWSITPAPTPSTSAPN